MSHHSETPSFIEGVIVKKLQGLGTPMAAFFGGHWSVFKTSLGTMSQESMEGDREGFPGSGFKGLT